MRCVQKPEEGDGEEGELCDGGVMEAGHSDLLRFGLSPWNAVIGLLKPIESVGVVKENRGGTGVRGWWRRWCGRYCRGARRLSGVLGLKVGKPERFGVVVGGRAGV